MHYYQNGVARSSLLYEQGNSMQKPVFKMSIHNPLKYIQLKLGLRYVQTILRPPQTTDYSSKLICTYLRLSPQPQTSQPSHVNCEKKVHVSVLANVAFAPLSIGWGVCGPSNATHVTGYPGVHPEYTVLICFPLPAAGSGGEVVGTVQLLFFTIVSRIVLAAVIGNT